MTRTRLLAALLSVALGASATFAFSADHHSDSARRRPNAALETRASTKKLTWRRLFETMLPPALRCRPEDSPSTSSDAPGLGPAGDSADAPDTGLRLDCGFLAEELAQLARLARRAVESRS